MSVLCVIPERACVFSTVNGCEDVSVIQCYYAFLVPD